MTTCLIINDTQLLQKCNIYQHERSRGYAGCRKGVMKNATRGATAGLISTAYVYNSLVGRLGLGTWCGSV